MSPPYRSGGNAMEERWQACVSALRRAIDQAVPLSVSLRRAVAAQSRAYRGSTPPVISRRADAEAYVASRMPATMAAAGAALRATATATPTFAPTELLDVGAGSGSASWAATAVWPSIERIAALDRSDAMLGMGRELAALADVPALAGAAWVLGSAARSELPAADVVTAGYLLGEVADEDRAALVARLWEAARGLLVLVEPGTPQGFARIRTARSQLVDLGGSVAAPCPHDAACPMVEPDWCHFAARLGRSRLHRSAKGVALGYEDEPFSYVAVSRLPVEPASRVLARPSVRKGAIGLRLCTPDGIMERTVTRGEGAAFRRARHLAWGSSWMDEEA